jgi:hypothetical protein
MSKYPDNRYPNFSSTQNNWEWYTGEAFLSAWLESILDLSQPENQRTSQAIARNFQSCNKIAEVVDRHINAIAPNRVEGLPQSLKILHKKWQKENAGIFGNPLEEAILKAKIDGRSYLRLFFQQTYTAETKEEALEVHCAPIGSVIAYRNSDRFLTQFDYHYTEKGESFIERQFLNKGLTIFQTIFKSEVIKEFSLDLGGGFTIIEINLPLLVTKSIKQNQNAINFALTLLPHNLAYSGWIQESILNAQPPGKWEYDAQGREIFTPNPEGLASGAGITRFVQGLPLNDERNNLIGYTQPDIKLQQPIDPDTFLKTYSNFSHIIYDQCNQSWVSNIGLVLSEKSRKEAIKDFNLAIIKDSEKLGFALSDLFSVCNFLLGNKQKVDVNTLPNLEIDDETRKIIIELHKERLMSKRTAITLLGFVADADAELAELAKEKPPAPVGDAGGGLGKNQSI